MDEGSNWEAMLIGAQHKLDNAIVIIDYNKWQGFGKISEVLNLEPLADK
ncbi:MAG: transketolase, partial [Bacteroidota bacterium]